MYHSFFSLHMTGYAINNIAGYVPGYLFQEQEGGRGPTISTKESADVFDELFPGAVATFSSVNLTLPVNTLSADTRAATKKYVNDAVDAAIAALSSGLSIRYAVHCASTTDLGALPVPYVYNAAAGTHTLTSGNAVLSEFDDFPVAIGTRILLKDQANTNSNGVFVFTAIGTNAVLLRASDSDGLPDPTLELGQGMERLVTSGTTHANQVWAQVSSTPLFPYVGLSPLTYTLVNAQPAIPSIAPEVPVGSVHMIAGAQPGYDATLQAKGFLYCDGASLFIPLSRGGNDTTNEYEDLYDAIGVLYGTGPGPNKFKIPNLTSGQFIRSLGGLAAGLGIAQTQDFLAHTHGGVTGTESVSHTHAVATISGGAHAKQILDSVTPAANDLMQIVGIVGSGLVKGLSYITNGELLNGSINTVNDGAHTHATTVGDASVSHTHSIASAGGAETRPNNVAMRYYMKVKRVAVAPFIVGTGLVLASGNILNNTYPPEYYGGFFKSSLTAPRIVALPADPFIWIGSTNMPGSGASSVDCQLTLTNLATYKVDWTISGNVNNVKRWYAQLEVNGTGVSDQPVTVNGTIGSSYISQLPAGAVLTLAVKMHPDDGAGSIEVASVAITAHTVQR